jgi:hypothetical protein
LWRWKHDAATEAYPGSRARRNPGHTVKKSSYRKATSSLSKEQMTVIIKVYEGGAKAQAAVAELKAASFDNATIVSTGKDGTVVQVDPAFGKGGQADAILNRHSPLRDASHKAGSSLLGSSGMPRPFESRTTFGGELTGPNFFLSSIFGPLLSSSQAPWSSLAASQKPWSSLTRSQKPWSSLANNQNGSAKLIHNSTLFSSYLGLPVLIVR